MRLSAIAYALAGISSAAFSQSYQRTETGIVVTPAQGPEAAIRLQVYGDEIIRVSSAPAKDVNLPTSLMVIAKPRNGGFFVTETPGSVTLKTAKVSADVNLA